MSSKAKPQVTTQQNTVDPMASRFQGYVFDKAKDVLDPRFDNPEKYVAGFNTDQQNAFTNIRGLQGGITPGDVQSWMNPYTSAVVDTTTQRMRDEADRNLASIRARGAAGSAFGGVGARSALAENRAQATNQQQMAEMTAKLMAQGYDQATATAITNQGLKGSAAEALLGIGNQQQQHEQFKMDAPLRTLGIAHGIMPQQFSSTNTTTAPNTAPSPLQQALGIAGTAAGMYFGGPMGAQIGGQLGGMAGGAMAGNAAPAPEMGPYFGPQPFRPY
jgi:hypothetical protein